MLNRTENIATPMLQPQPRLPSAASSVTQMPWRNAEPAQRTDAFSDPAIKATLLQRRLNPQLVIPTAADYPARWARAAVRVHGEGFMARCHESSPRTTRNRAGAFPSVDINLF